MTESPKPNAPLWQKIALIVGGTIFGIALIVAVIVANPSLIRRAPESRNEAGTTMDVTFRMTDGDYFFYQAGRIRPPAEDTILGTWTLAWDADGFRIPALQAEHYPIAAFGDSFTEGAMVAMPWVDVLAQELDVPVFNFGYRGYGPLEIASVAEEYLAGEPRTWVLYAHFSGNDLANGNRALTESLVQRDPLSQLTWLTRQAIDRNQTATVTLNPNDHYDYPMPVIIGASYYDMAFLEDLLWWELAPEGGYMGTKTFDIVAGALDRVAAQATDTACRALIFIPTKEQLYYPYIHEDVRQWLRGIARFPVTDENGFVNLQDRPFTEAEEPAIIAGLNAQRDAMRELADLHGWRFIDLLEPFQQAVAEGQLLYYQYDGHWNQNGANLAGQIIADYMRENSTECPLDNRE